MHPMVTKQEVFPAEKKIDLTNVMNKSPYATLNFEVKNYCLSDLVMQMANKLEC